MLELYNKIMNEENKRERSGVKKSMRNRCVKTGSKHFDKETLNKLLIESGWEGLKEKEILFFYKWFFIKEFWIEQIYFYPQLLYELMIGKIFSKNEMISNTEYNFLGLI